MNNVHVSSLSTALRTKRRYEAIITIEDPNLVHGLRFHKPDHPDHLVLRFEDVDFPAPNVALPDRRHVEIAVEFGRQHAGRRILVHCKAGIARSTAIALALIADQVGDERRAIGHLLEVRREAIPNLMVLAMADEVLGRSGRLIEAWMEIENANPEYASHRAAKRQILERNPMLFSRPLGSFEISAYRFLPGSLKGQVARREETRAVPVP